MGEYQELRASPSRSARPDRRASRRPRENHTRRASHRRCEPHERSASHGSGEDQARGASHVKGEHQKNGASHIGSEHQGGRASPRVGEDQSPGAYGRRPAPGGVPGAQSGRTTSESPSCRSPLPAPAAQVVCSYYFFATDTDRARCVRDATADAVTKINQPALSAVYNANNRTSLPSGLVSQTR